jgi:hypothetical protein
MERWNTGRLVKHQDKLLCFLMEPIIPCLATPVPTVGGAGRHYSIIPVFQLDFVRFHSQVR